VKTPRSGHASPSPFSWLPVVLAIPLLAVALFVGVRTTQGLEWPGADWSGVGIDLYRDISSAQTMVKEGFGADPTYRGEKTWYNPMTPAISAIVSAATGLPVHRVVTQIGAYANLLAPIAFFAMCAVLFDAWTALFALAGFLFLLSGHLPSYVSATYSPWFLPVNFVQTWFYVTVIALSRAHRRGRMLDYALAGVLWGVTFLGHTAPALVLGGMVTVWAVAGVRGRRSPDEASLTPGRVLARYALMTGAALVVSLPFVLIIVGRYALHIQNPEPTAFSEYLLSRGLPTMVLIHLTAPMAIAAVGILALARHEPGSSRRLVLSWMAVSSAFLLYSFVRLGAKAIDFALPSIVPSFHFFFYLKAATAVCFGIGAMAVARAIAEWRPASSPAWSRGQAPAIAAVLVLGLLAASASTYESRPDFFPARLDARTVTDSDMTRVSEWFHQNAQSTDVVLAPDKDGATAVVTAGVKVVAIYGGFSNPYVALEPRRRARDAMYVALGRDDRTTFRRLADQYGVSYVLTHSAHPPFGAAALRDLDLRFSTGTYQIWAVRRSSIPLTAS
jgi:hypothetical protein